MGKCRIANTGGGGNLKIKNGKVVMGFAENGSIEGGMFVEQVVGASATNKLPNSPCYDVIPVNETQWLEITASGSNSSSTFTGRILTLNKSTGAISQGTAVTMFYAPYNGLRYLWKANSNTFIGVVSNAYIENGTVYVIKIVVSDTTITVSQVQVPNAQSASSSTGTVAHWISPTRVIVAVSDAYRDSYGTSSFSVVVSMVDTENMKVLASNTAYSNSGATGGVRNIANYRENKVCLQISERPYRSDTYYNREISFDSNGYITIGTMKEVVSEEQGTFGSAEGRCWKVEDGYWVSFNNGGRMELYYGDTSALGNNAVQYIDAPGGAVFGPYRTSDGRTILIAGKNIYEYIWSSNKKFTRVLLGTTTQDFGSHLSYSYMFDTWITDDLKLFLANGSYYYWLDTVERLVGLQFRVSASSAKINGINQDKLTQDKLGKVWVFNS